MKQVERIFAQRLDDSGSGADGGTESGTCKYKYLVKWEGLPYGEATWEFEADLLATGDQGRAQVWRGGERGNWGDGG